MLICANLCLFFYCRMQNQEEKTKASASAVSAGSAGSAAVLSSALFASSPMPRPHPLHTISIGALNAIALQKAITVHSNPAQIAEWINALGPQFKPWSKWIMDEHIHGVDLMANLSIFDITAYYDHHIGIHLNAKRRVIAEIDVLRIRLGYPVIPQYWDRAAAVRVVQSLHSAQTSPLPPAAAVAATAVPQTNEKQPESPLVKALCGSSLNVLCGQYV